MRTTAHDTGVTPVPWAVVLIEIGGLMAMGVAGLSMIRARDDGVLDAG